MGTKIILELPSDFNADESDLKQLLRDALGEFVSARTPISTYVNERYGGFAPGQTFLALKRAEVQKRVLWAAELGYAAIRKEKT